MGCEYDMRGQLVAATVTNIDGAPWTAAYAYLKDGKMRTGSWSKGHASERAMCSPGGRSA